MSGTYDDSQPAQQHDHQVEQGILFTNGLRITHASHHRHLNCQKVSIAYESYMLDSRQAKQQAVRQNSDQIVQAVAELASSIRRRQMRMRND